MITHENTLKTILDESRRLFDNQDKLINEASLKFQTDIKTSQNSLSKVDQVLNEVKEIKTFILAANTKHHKCVINSSNTLVKLYDTEAKLADKLADKELKIKYLQVELAQTKNEFEKLLDVKLAPILSQIKHGVTSSSAPSQQVGPKEVEVVKEEQKKKDEELERLKLYQDEFNRIEGKKRDKEAIEATLRILWLEWTMKRMQDVAIKKVRKNWLEPNSLYLVDLPLSESIANKMLQIRRLGRTHQKVN
ncbi:unnamed protein product [Lactuca saligna]|uniref:Uncharacterized protein n=1 Tax=Lactuca saligna TaxID=75948 RepID=A0AA35V8D4_LACSI|nr:unnamed protein product [Lactuca saligna]